jgi:hypothetical protein
MARDEKHLNKLKEELYYRLLGLQTNEIRPNEIHILYDLSRDPHIQELLREHTRMAREALG